MFTMTKEEKDLYYMERAITLAKEAAEMDEVPVGAVLVSGDRIVGEGKNLRETKKCATRHAELCAIEEACATLGGWRLPDSTLYVTLEPCPMCAGAIINARVERVVYGAADPKGGAMGSVIDLASLPFNHKPAVEAGVEQEKCKDILTNYFKTKRDKPNWKKTHKAKTSETE